MEMGLLLSIILIVTFILTFIIRYFALKKSILDKPSERSSHTTPTPRGGGLSIVISFYLGLVYLFIKGDIENQLFFALLSGIPLIIISIIDDVVNVSPRIRFITQLISSILALYFLKGFQVIDLGFIQLKWVWGLSIIAVFGMVWFINLYNFIDGIDGYASMEAIFVAGVLYYFTKSEVVLILVVATLGFLPWNWQRAKIFMGDVGSTLLGFILIVLGIYLQNESIFSFVNWLILTSLFWFDATITLYRRWRNVEKLSVAHRKHAFQRIVQAGFSHQKTTLLGLILNIVIFFLLLIFIRHFQKYMVFLLMIVLFILLMLTLIIDKKKPFNQT